MRMGDINKTESKYLSKEDLEQYGAGGVILTIDTVSELNLAKEGEFEKKRPLIAWVEEMKPLICNPTNWGNIKLALGADNDTDTSALPGRRLVLWADPTVEFNHRRVGGIVIKTVQLDAPIKAPLPPQPPANQSLRRPPPPAEAGPAGPTPPLPDVSDIPY